MNQKCGIELIKRNLAELKSRISKIEEWIRRHDKDERVEAYG